VKKRQQAVCIDRDGVERWRGDATELAGLFFVVPSREADATITYKGDEAFEADPWVWREVSREEGLAEAMDRAGEENRRRTMANVLRGLNAPTECPHCGKELP
jgi:hypothetical protein